MCHWTTLVLPDIELGTMMTSERIYLIFISWSFNISASTAMAVSETVGETSTNEMKSLKKLVCLLHQKSL